MYEVFDSFLQIGTWHTFHPADEKRFFLALSQVVKNPSFSPEKMGSYMRLKTGSPSKAGDHPFDRDITRFETKAETVREYLAAAQELAR